MQLTVLLSCAELMTQFKLDASKPEEHIQIIFFANTNVINDANHFLISLSKINHLNIFNPELLHIITINFRATHIFYTNLKCE